MLFLVHSQCSGSHEAAIANFTNVGSLIGVFSFMIGKVTLGCEGFATSFELTTEWLFTCVNSDMGLKISVFCKLLATDMAMKGLFSRVGPLMDFESSRSRVLFAAYIACKGLFTCMD